MNTPTPNTAPLRIVIVSPVLADANNGNWQTAQRWRALLAPHSARIVKQWPDADAHQHLAQQDQVMLALHARRSAASVAAWAERKPSGTRGLAVVLTGTDLYRDIQDDAAAQTSLALASQLVVLQANGPAALPVDLHAKTRVIFQSSTALPTVAKPPATAQLRAVMVGHLRAEKSPQTLFAAARLLQAETTLFIDHIGEALDPALGQAAQATAAACPNYRWLGTQPNKATRRHIQRAHVLVHTSLMEGGAHVIMEAVLSGTPVLASRIPGNVGMLGDDYAGYFELGDAEGLAELLRRCRDDDWLAQLSAQCALRAPLFSAESERAALHQLVHDLNAPSNINKA
ncbi:MAG: TIGR04348 family glycosyltransferase [Polaromonas sp.]|nr:TIGR04348 family glycosyltransferase [Polaromonas sp.]